MDVCFDCVRVFLALVAMKNKVTVLGVSDVCCSRLKGSISEMIPLPSFIELFFPVIVLPTLVYIPQLLFTPVHSTLYLEKVNFMPNILARK